MNMVTVVAVPATLVKLSAVSGTLIEINDMNESTGMTCAVPSAEVMVAETFPPTVFMIRTSACARPPKSTATGVSAARLIVWLKLRTRDSVSWMGASQLMAPLGFPEMGDDEYSPPNLKMSVMGA